MPASASSCGSVSVLNCGLVRERGTERTSTSRSTPASCNMPTSSATLRVECPIVKTVPAGRGSIHVLAAIDRERRAGDEVGLVGDQEQDRAGNVLGFAKTADRDARNDLLQYLRRYRAHHLGIDIARRDGIDCDAARGAFLRQRLGETMDTGFRGGVVYLAVLPRLAVDRADIDDAAETAIAHALDDSPRHVEARGEIGLHDRVPLLEAHAVDRRVAGNAGVVDQHL